VIIGRRNIAIVSSPKVPLVDFFLNRKFILKTAEITACPSTGFSIKESNITVTFGKANSFKKLVGIC
jgi:hypothetical protein